jgi:hypothetical protein
MSKSHYCDVADWNSWVDLEKVARVQTNGTFIVPTSSL